MHGQIIIQSRGHRWKPAKIIRGGGGNRTGAHTAETGWVHPTSRRVRRTIKAGIRFDHLPSRHTARFRKPGVTDSCISQVPCLCAGLCVRRQLVRLGLSYSFSRRHTTWAESAVGVSVWAAEPATHCRCPCGAGDQSSTAEGAEDQRQAGSPSATSEHGESLNRRHTVSASPRQRHGATRCACKAQTVCCIQWSALCAFPHAPLASAWL